MKKFKPLAIALVMTSTVFLAGCNEEMRRTSESRHRADVQIAAIQAETNRHRIEAAAETEQLRNELAAQTQRLEDAARIAETGSVAKLIGIALSIVFLVLGLGYWVWRAHRNIVDRNAELQAWEIKNQTLLKMADMAMDPNSALSPEQRDGLVNRMIEAANNPMLTHQPS